MYFDGELEGSVELPNHTLTVGLNGKVNANVTARNVVVHGTLQSNIQASERVEINKTASVVGDLITARIAIEDGAYLKGSVEIVRPSQTEAKPDRMNPHACASPACSSKAVAG